MGAGRGETLVAVCVQLGRTGGTVGGGGGDIPGSIVPWDIELVNNNAFLLAPFPPAKVVNRLGHLVKS